MALYGLFNFYIYILAYLFSPGGGSLHGKLTLTDVKAKSSFFFYLSHSEEWGVRPYYVGLFVNEI